MTNREKYKFDYFTIDNYRKVVELAKGMGFSFILHKDDFVEERKDIIWRHDVEFSPEQALKMAKIEHEFGVKATYFWQIHSEFYNLFNRHFSDILLEIKSLGHHIGLHFDSHYWNIKNEAELNRYIEIDKNYLETVFGFNIDTYSFHNTNPFVLGCKEYKYGGLVNVYAQYFKDHYSYCADSTGYWRYEVLDEVLRNPLTRHLQVLIHDAMWSDEVMSPRKRVMNYLQSNAKRIEKSYDDNMVEFGAKNIDEDVVL